MVAGGAIGVETGGMDYSPYYFAINVCTQEIYYQGILPIQPLAYFSIYKQNGLLCLLGGYTGIPFLFLSFVFFCICVCVCVFSTRVFFFVIFVTGCFFCVFYFYFYFFYFLFCFLLVDTGVQCFSWKTHIHTHTHTHTHNVNIKCCKKYKITYNANKHNIKKRTTCY